MVPATAAAISFDVLNMRMGPALRRPQYASYPLSLHFMICQIPLCIEVLCRTGCDVGKSPVLLLRPTLSLMLSLLSLQILDKHWTSIHGQEWGLVAYIVWLACMT